MKIEHFAYQVAEPPAVTDWYCEHLGFSVKRAGNDVAQTYFLADESGQVMIEIYANPAIEVPPYRDMNPLTLHLAFVCDDIPQTIERLQQVGATIAVETMITPIGDELVMLRDPWGMAIQLCNRAQRLV